jgi:hypothetical protein
VKLIGDNKGIQQKMARFQHNKLGHHRDPNVDLFLEYEKATLKRQVNWVNSHQDEETPWESINDLAALKLTTAVTLNCLCDNILLQYQKVIGQLDKNIHTQLYTEALEQYVGKNGLSAAKLKDINVKSFQHYLKAN